MRDTMRDRAAGMDLTKGDIFRCLLKFSSAIIAANMLQQLYSMVDLIVIGQFVGSTGTVGVSTGGEVMDFLTPVATSFAAAAQIYFAQLSGAGEDEKLKKAIGTVITWMLSLSIMLCIASLALHTRILQVLNCPSEAFAQASVYLCISVFGLPFVFCYNAVCGMLRGIGESKKPLLFVAVAAVVNVFLDILLVAVFRLDAAGTAIATVLSQVGAFIASVIYLYRRREQFGIQFRLSYLGFDLQTMKVLMALGIPGMVQSLGVRFSLAWCQAHVNAYGLTASATNSIGNKLQKLITVFVAGINSSAGIVIGQNLGARKYDRVRKTVWYCLGMTLTIAAVGCILAVIMPKTLFRVFTADAAVLENSVIYMRIMCVTYFAAAMLGPFQSLLTGAGYASFNFVIGMLDGVVCRIGLSCLFAYFFTMGVNGFYLGSASARIIPAIITMGYFLSGRWKQRKLLTET